MGPTLISISIYTSLLSYLLAVICWVTGVRSKRYIWLWTIGCVFLWLHALAAFHFHHHWSHADAVKLTAEETLAVIGWSYGNGIWFSYLLLMVWLVDVIQLWRNRDQPSRIWNYFSIAVHAYAFFILFNGTVVFKHGVIRWGGTIGTIWIIRMAWRYRRVTFWRPRTSELPG